VTADLPASRRTEGCSREYVAAVDQALGVANTSAHDRGFERARLTQWGSPHIDAHEHLVWSAANPRLSAPRHARAPRTTLWRIAIRAAARTLLAFAALAAFGVYGAAVLVDWFAPSGASTACTQVALPLVVGVAALAALGLAGAVVREVAERRRGDTS
jgi:hypothetical protein